MWKWFSGKKTIIGTVLVYVAQYLIGDFLIGEIQFSPEWLLVIQKAFLWIGGVLVPGGLLHKGVKAKKK